MQKEKKTAVIPGGALTQLQTLKTDHALIKYTPRDYLYHVYIYIFKLLSRALATTPVIERTLTFDLIIQATALHIMGNVVQPHHFVVGSSLKRTTLPVSLCVRIRQGQSSKW